MWSCCNEPAENYPLKQQLLYSEFEIITFVYSHWAQFFFLVAAGNCFKQKEQ